MQWLKSTTIIRAYLMAIIVVGMTFSSTPEFVLVIALLILNLYAAYRQLPLKINIALRLGTIILAPLILTPLTGSISSVFVLPAIYLLDESLKQYALTQPLQPQKRTREPTPLLKSTIIALGVILATSIILLNITLFFSTALLIVYFTYIFIVAIIKIPKNPIRDTKTWSRLHVGNAEKKTIQIFKVAKQPLYVTVIPLQTWVRVKQQVYFLKNDKKVDLEVTFTPPLAGPTVIQLNVSTLDLRGLIQTTQLLEPIDLHVLPRAKYAQWLAQKYLKETTFGSNVTSTVTPRIHFNAVKYGVEFYGSRLYQPGDKLRYLDWKHTFKLKELIIKEFSSGYGQPILIVASTVTKNPQEADMLAYNMVMAVLLAANERLPTGLAIYNQKEVLAAVAPTDPIKVLKETVKLTQKISIEQKCERGLEQVNVAALKRSTRQQRSKKTESTERLLQILKYEYSALQWQSKNYPASEALTKSLKNTKPPAQINMVSFDADDGSAFELQRLKSRGYRITGLVN